MAKRSYVNVTAQISGGIEVEADSEDEAEEIARNADYDEWGEVCIDSTDTPDGVELLSVVCDECDEDEDDCTCEVCDQCDKLIDDCTCVEDVHDDEKHD